MCWFKQKTWKHIKNKQTMCGQLLGKVIQSSWSGIHHEQGYQGNGKGKNLHWKWIVMFVFTWAPLVNYSGQIKIESDQTAITNTASAIIPQNPLIHGDFLFLFSLSLFVLCSPLLPPLLFCHPHKNNYLAIVFFLSVNRLLFFCVWFLNFYFV